MRKQLLKTANKRHAFFYAHLHVVVRLQTAHELLESCSGTVGWAFGLIEEED